MNNLEDKQIKMNEYQAANLIGLMIRNFNNDNGDWFYETLYKFHDILLSYLSTENQTSSNNFGDTIPRDIVEFREWIISNRDT